MARGGGIYIAPTLQTSRCTNGPFFCVSPTHTVVTGALHRLIRCPLHGSTGSSCALNNKNRADFEPISSRADAPTYCTDSYGDHRRNHRSIHRIILYAPTHLHRSILFATVSSCAVHFVVLCAFTPFLHMSLFRLLFYDILGFLRSSIVLYKFS